jgi:hypothetical protein
MCGIVDLPEPCRPCWPPAAEKILGKEPQLKADFSRAQQAVSKARQKGVARYLPNPGGQAKGCPPLRATAHLHCMSPFSPDATKPTPCQRAGTETES